MKLRGGGRGGEAGLPGPKKLIRPNLAISSFKKAKSLKMKKAK